MMGKKAHYTFIKWWYIHIMIMIMINDVSHTDSRFTLLTPALLAPGHFSPAHLYNLRQFLRTVVFILLAYK